MITLLVRVWEDAGEESDALVEITEDELADLAIATYEADHPDTTIQHTKIEAITFRN